MLKYLKSTSSSAAVNSGTVTALAENITRLNNAVSMGNITASINSVTGTLVVAGGVGIGGNLNIAGNISGSALTATSARVNGVLTVVGSIVSTNINNSGTITAASGNIGIVNATTVTASVRGTFGNLQVNNLANIGTVTAISGTISTLTAASASISTLSASSASTNSLFVDSLAPRTGAQMDLGAADKVRITGGAVGQVLGTDGNGNLAWTDGPGALTVGTGLVRSSNIISLSSTGFVPGTYDRVTIDQFGRVVSGTSLPETLDTVVSRGAFTSQIVSLTNSTDSTDPTEGALIVSGGVGVGATLVANQVVSKGDVVVEGTLRTLNGVQASQTVVFDGANAGTVPLRISAGGLIPQAVAGSVEFDGDYVYITTSSGRQILQVRDPNAPASPVALVRAVASRTIDIDSAYQTINDGDVWDDVILNRFDRVLLTSQSDPAENGVYVWQGEGAALIRATDFGTTTGIFSGTAIFVAEGVVNRNSIWQINTVDPISVGVTSLDIVQTHNLNNAAIAALPKNSSSGIVTRTQYGTVALRTVRSSSSWITIANADGKLGNFTIGTGIVPVASGGTGRTSITGWMKGNGASIASFPTIPLSDIAGVGTMASQSAASVNISGGTIAVSSATVANLSGTNAQISGTTTANVVTANSITVANLIVTGGTNGFDSKGADPSNWDTNLVFGLFGVNRTSWSGTIGTPTDAYYVGMLTVLVSDGIYVQKYQPTDTTSLKGAEFYRTKTVGGSWTSWSRVIGNTGLVDGGNF